MIILLGYMGSGKSAVGKHLAASLALPFLDFDDYIEEKEGMSITEIFKSKGEIYFRKAEHIHLKELLAHKPEVVLSLGGGTPCYSGNIELILAASKHVFYLNTSIPVLTGRLIKEKSHRPVIAHLNEADLTEFIGKHLFERNAFYRKAHHSILVKDKSIAEIASEIKQLL
ncbi:shikimate kinase [Neptunitalea lumnitzerae]|uniref:Shikimate kinase n=1 Tax=Neptunitalea lumnitzerae TaxID=2965509 RepID=A0ABQ5MM42_9FLAO|nr:shikimate kinase [Neptunitalea sp. Y10]GLB50483.1 shikimate kinase [Neptunitalea sp. Y10]